MTNVTVFCVQERITRLCCKGHAGAKAAGENVVCAAVSILMQNCVNALEQVAGVTPQVTADEALALIDISLPPMESERGRDAQTILRTTVLGLTDIGKAYPKLVKLSTLNGRNIE